ncbi:uncharacterized protein [Coffea arabica]|uniref:Uncharacterized protein isoform X2 n=1 Tax=Coffea arabica TaxID=13443 RepID=A0ABM4VT02_COFAR
MKLKYGGHNTNTSSSIHTTHSWKAAVSRSTITFTTNTRAAGGGAPSDSKAGCRSPSLLILCYSDRPKFSSSSTNASTNRTRYNSPSKFNWSIPDAYKDSGDGPHHTDRLTDSDEELDDVDIEIQKTGYNRRRIQSRVSVDASLQSVWNVLTDYEKLADFIPGLAVSQLLQKTDNFVRLFQIGQQNLAFGLKFKAKGVIDCYEKEIQNLPFGKRRDIEFEMIEGDFQLFQGKWCVEQAQIIAHKNPRGTILRGTTSWQRNPENVSKRLSARRRARREVGVPVSLNTVVMVVQLDMWQFC